MNILWGIIGILALAGFASVAILAPWTWWDAYKFMKIVRKCVGSGEMPAMLRVKPRWRGNMAFGYYILTKQYEREEWEEVRAAGRHTYKLNITAVIVTLVTMGLFLAILLAAP